jgi:thiamine-phosphate pyrophosphorylase
LSAIEGAISAGVDLIQIREKDLEGRALEKMTREAVSLACGSGYTKILVNDRLDVALACEAHGIHVPGDGLRVDSIRKCTPPGFIIGASTHSLDDIRRAAAGGADLVVFGPVYPTPSKPGAPGVGIQRLAEVVRGTNLPVYALGGITPDHVPEVAATGAAGVAGISVFMRDDSLEKLMREIRSWNEGNPENT